jgi:hypothetical protein
VNLIGKNDAKQNAGYNAEGVNIGFLKNAPDTLFKSAKSTRLCDNIRFHEDHLKTPCKLRKTIISKKCIKKP